MCVDRGICGSGQFLRPRTIQGMVTLGSQDAYEWLVTDDENVDLLEICPEIVLGKYVAITSIDSGKCVPTQTETASGWRSREGIAYSPKVQNPTELPREGWDEWYVFAEPHDLGKSHLKENIFEVPHEPGHLSVFVNYCFVPHQQESRILSTLFWEQMARIRLQSDNDYLTFVSSDQTLFARVREAMKPS